MSAHAPLSRQAEDFVVGNLYYNGVNFPPSRKMKGTYEPVYDDSGRIAKYLKGKIEVECILFPGCLEDPAVLAGSSPSEYVLPYRRAQSVSAVTDGTSKDATTDTTLDEIRKRLSEPCQWLKIDKQGAGYVNLNDPTGLSPKDVNNGPKPQNIRWSPLTNKMAKVEWSIEFCFSPCDNIATGQHSHGHDFCQFPFEVSMDINDRGLAVRTVTGKVELARTRIPTVNANAGASESFSMLKLEQQILSVFPRGKQFQRTDQKFQMSADRKYVRFSIVDTEINSVDSYGEGILREDVRVTTSSSFDGDGACFTRWMTTMEGSINLIPGYTKVWAWQEMTRLLQRYMFSVAGSGRPPSAISGTSFDDYYHLQNLNNTGLNAGQSLAILRNIKYTDNIFDRSVQFSYTWELFVNPDDIFKVTGLFTPIEATHNERDARWNKWLVSTSQIYDSGGWQQVEFNNNMDIVVSLCDAWYGPKATGIPTLAGQPTKEEKKAPGDNKIKNHNKKVLPPPPDKNNKGANGFYSMYDCRFGIDSIHGSMSHTPLYSLPAARETASNYSRMLGDNGSIKLDNNYGSGGVEPPKPVVHRVRPNTHIITMTGYAQRLGLLPQIPNVNSISGLPVYKIGVDKIRPVLLGGGIDLINGSTYSVHGLAWQKQYIVYGDPSEIKITSDGHKAGILPG